MPEYPDKDIEHVCATAGEAGGAWQPDNLVDAIESRPSMGHGIDDIIHADLCPERRELRWVAWIV